MSKSKIIFTDDPEPNSDDEKIPESIDSESDTDIEPPNSDDSDAENDAEYKGEANSDNESDNEPSEHEEEQNESEEEEILENIVAEDDEDYGDDNKDDNPGDDPPDEVLDGDDEDGGEEVKKRKSTVRSKTAKRRLFPFIQAKRKAIIGLLRDPPLYSDPENRVRQGAAEYLQNACEIEHDNSLLLEKAIAVATARIFRKEGVEPDPYSEYFKTRYLEILRHVVGVIAILPMNEIINELKTDSYGFKSKIYESEHIKDKEMEEAIRNPDDITEDSNYPCPACKGIKHTRLLIQDRSGDEGASLTLWCENKSCGKKWKIGG